MNNRNRQIAKAEEMLREYYEYNEWMRVMEWETMELEEQCGAK